MKPKEFDELIRQKFDQNDFAYKPQNWDQLAEKLEGRAKKRSVMMWWWVPLAGMAASVALAMGVAPLMKQNIPGSGNAGAGIAKAQKYAQPAEGTQSQLTNTEVISSHKEKLYTGVANNNSKQVTTRSSKNVNDWFHVVLNEKSGKTADKTNSSFNFLAGNNKEKTGDSKEQKKAVAIVNEGYNTFNPDEEAVQKIPRVSIILTGGYYQGGQNTGYTGGAVIRKMVNDNVYIENEVAFTTSSNSQSVSHGTWVANGGSVGSVAARHMDAKNSSPNAKEDQSSAPTGSEVVNTQEYNCHLYYAQVSPAIGFKVIKRMFVGLGPDFQQMLVDNRPPTSNVDRGNIEVAPMFDVGMIGKTEYALTKKIRATIAYRRGINNILTPSDKFIDRDYLQFQLKCTIFNK